MQSLTSLPSVCRGQAQNQELGYGPNGKKSSANPEKCYALENVYTHQVNVLQDCHLAQKGVRAMRGLCFF